MLVYAGKETKGKGAQVTVMVGDKEEAANEVRCEYHTKRTVAGAVNRVSDKG